MTWQGIFEGLIPGNYSCVGLLSWYHPSSAKDSWHDFSKFGALFGTWGLALHGLSPVEGHSLVPNNGVDLFT